MAGYGRIVGIVLEEGGRMTIKSIQPFIGGKPHKAFLVLQDLSYSVFRETPLARKILKTEVVRLRITYSTHAKEQQRTCDPC